MPDLLSFKVSEKFSSDKGNTRKPKRNRKYLSDDEEESKETKGKSKAKSKAARKDQD